MRMDCKQDTCEMCFGLRGHDRLKDVFCDLFETEHCKAQRECQRLSALFKEACWYNFETKCKSWQHPWPQSYLESTINMHGIRIETDTRNGREREIGTFPVYYNGPVRDAPALPPEILLVELEQSRAYLKACEEQLSAPYDWAPGGCKYKQLLLETNVPTELSKKRGRSKRAASRISRRLL